MRIQPNIVIPKEINTPEPEKVLTANGVPIYSVRIETQDVFRVSLVFRAGVKYQNSPFVASASLNMISEGTKNMSSKDIAEMLDFYGLYYDVNIDRDYSVITICALKRFTSEAMSLLKEIVLYPQFPQRELEIYAAKRKQALAIQRQKIDFIAREYLAMSLYGSDHPYGFGSDENFYDSINCESLKEFYRKTYNAENMFCVMSGMIDDENISEISDIIANIPSGNKCIIDMPKPVLTKNIYIEKSESLQSAIRIGRTLFPKEHPDYYDMQILATILGGYFSSRLVSNIREDKGYTYGVFSGMVNLEDSGYIAISTEVSAKNTDSAIEEIFKEMDILKKESVSSEELDMVRSVMIGEVMRILDGPFGIADVTIENIQCGKKNDEIAALVKNINDITPERLQNLAQKYFDFDQFTTVVVGSK